MSKKMQEKSEIKSSSSLLKYVFFVTTWLLLELVLGFYMYNILKQDLQKEFLNELRKGVGKEEFERLLNVAKINNEQFSSLNNDHVKRFRRGGLKLMLPPVFRPPLLPNVVSHSRPLFNPVGPLFKPAVRLVQNTVSTLQNLRVPKLPGRPGSPGRNGLPGAPGFKGQQGLVGQRGLRGLPGPRLPNSPGPPGPSGPQGPPGPHGLSNTKGPPGQKGPNGPTGPKGDTGDSGLDGTPGKNGRDGLDGFLGEKGDKGFIGFSGKQGEIGLTGEKGNPSDYIIFETDEQQCVRGEPGVNGEPGARGSPGVTGSRGLPGRCCFKEELNEKLVEIKKYGTNVYTDFDIYSEDRLIVSIEKPEFSNLNDNFYSSWMIDFSPVYLNDSEKVWHTTTDNYQLFEFASIQMLQKNMPSQIYELDTGFDGNANVIYNGAFYYKTLNSKHCITKLDLKSGTIKSLTIAELEQKDRGRLYLSNINYFDFSVDENGLWVIFSIPGSENTGVAKINDDNMTIHNVWEVNLDHKKYIDMFVASGTLYTLEYTLLDQIIIGKGINLFSNEVFNVNIKGIRTSGGITMATYNPRQNKLLITDDGKIISYPIVWGYGETLLDTTSPK